MKRIVLICLSIYIVLLTLSLPVHAVEDTVFIDTEAEWSFYVTNDEGFAAMDPTWKDLGYKGVWSVGSAPFGDLIDSPKAEQYGWQDPNNALFLRKSFKLRSATIYENMHFYLRIFYDNSVHVYLNGTEIFAHDNDGVSDWTNEFVLIELENVSDLLLKGENVLAVSVHDNAGRRELDLSFFATNEALNEDVVSPPDDPDQPDLPDKPDDPDVPTPPVTEATMDFGNALPFTKSPTVDAPPVVTVYVTAPPVAATPASEISYTAPVAMIGAATLVAILMVVVALLISRDKKGNRSEEKQ